MHVLKSSENCISPWFKMVNQTYAKYIGIIRKRKKKKFNYHPHNDILKQGKETCKDQNWICLSKMKDRVTRAWHQQDHTGTSTIYSLPGKSGGEGKYRCHPSPWSGLEAIQVRGRATLRPVPSTQQQPSQAN